MRAKNGDIVKRTNVEQEAILSRSQPSVEIKKDGKGAVSYTVKSYADVLEDAVADAVLAFKDISAILEEQKIGKGSD